MTIRGPETEDDGELDAIKRRDEDIVYAVDNLDTEKGSKKETMDENITNKDDIHGNDDDNIALESGHDIDVIYDKENATEQRGKEQEFVIDDDTGIVNDINTLEAQQNDDNELFDENVTIQVHDMHPFDTNEIDENTMTIE